MKPNVRPLPGVVENCGSGASIRRMRFPVAPLKMYSRPWAALHAGEGSQLFAGLSGS